jgi:16S rRNA (cytosine967-C5)-methyltransferase
MISPARLAAYHALRLVNAGRGDLPAALARSRVQLEDERDRALLVELTTGTLRWQGQLDYVIEQYAKRPLDRLDAEVIDILRLGLYQILHLDRVPLSAAVNEAVALARRAGKSSAAGFVNAVLRTASRHRHSIPLPLPPPESAGSALAGELREAALDYLSSALSHPRWLAARWLDRYGYTGAEEWERFNNTTAALTLRVNRLKTSPEHLVDALRSEGVELAPARYAPDGFVVRRGNPLSSPLAGAGWFFVQDEASQLVALLAAARPGERVLDTCAAPGGKATAMAASMRDEGLLVAADARGRRVALLRQTVAASGARCVRIVQADLRKPPPFRPTFDLVLVDAPCSGLGTVRRDPEVRWRRREADLPVLAASQREMLVNASEAVREGGRLVYATCSSEPEENDEVVEAFLKARGSFRRTDPRDQNRLLAPGLAAVLDDKGYLRTMPAVHRLDAFFGAVLQRKG